MSKIGIVIGREFFLRIRRKSFIVMTLLMPLLFVGISVLPMAIAMISNNEEKIAVIEPNGTSEYLDVLKGNKHIQFEATDQTLAEIQKQGRDNQNDFTGVLEIRQDLIEDSEALTLFSFKQLPPDVSNYIDDKLSDYLTDKKLQSCGVENIKSIVAESQVNISTLSYKWGDDGSEERSSGELASFLGMGLTMISFIFIMTYGAQVMAGIMEEKKNRIMEIMVSSVRPFDMMMGKIIGIGLVGILQMVIWGLLTYILLMVGSLIGFGGLYSADAIASMQTSEMTGMVSSMGTDSLGEMQEILSVIAGVNWFEIITMFILYFVGGYILFSSLFAAAASLVTSDEDANQFMAPITIFMMLGYFVGIGSMRNPEGALAFWGSLIPFTSPVVMMVRLPYDVPFWQLLVSLVLLFGTAVGLIYLSSRIYRVGILMYGKKPSWKDIPKIFKY